MGTLEVGIAGRAGIVFRRTWDNLRERAIAGLTTKSI
jgi:hypothetical protein